MNTVHARWLSISLSLIAATALSGAVAERGDGPMQTVTVGPGADCQYSNLQSAIWDAEDNTELRLENVTFTGDFDIDPIQNLVIQGGFDTCSDAQPGFSSTLDADGAGSPLTISQNATGSEVTLRNLNLIGGAPGTVSEGGGLDILSNQGAHDVTLIDVLIQNNTSNTSGGGIRIIGGPDSRLRIQGDTIIQNNRVTGSDPGVYAGGGLHCSGINGGPLISFDRGLIFLNEADGPGGGIRVDGCRLSINARGALQGVISNTSTSGGGISAARGSVVVIQGDRENLVSISGNSADGPGGGLIAGGTTELEIFNASIDSNTSTSDGGGIHLLEDAELVMEPSSAAACENETCSILEGNSARYGGAIHVADPGASAVVRQTRIHGNTNQSGRSGAVASVSDGSLTLESSFIYENSGTEAFRLLNDGNLKIAWSTLADNTASSGNPALINLRASDTDQPSLGLLSNIIRNPGRDVLFIDETFGSDYTTEVDCVIANELATLAGFTRSLVDDPEFVDPSADDYHIQASSPAIDACDDTNPPIGADIDGDPRGSDFGSASTRVFDIGADEFLDGLFADRFES
jgi:hypothetical protein